MKKTLMALCASSLSLTGCGSDVTEEYDRYRMEIINGTPAEHAQFPSIVALKSISSGEEYCSGTLIKRDLVLTAAHCLDDFYFEVNPHVVVYGSSDLTSNEGVERKMEVWKRNPNFNPFDAPWNDLGLILLESEMPDAVTAPFLLPEQYESFLTSGTLVTIAGYGQNSEMQYGVLEYAEVPVIARDDFEIQVGEDNPAAPNACFGDSGGPIYVTDVDTMYVSGVASHLPAVAQQCGESAIYTLPGSYVSWIEETYPELQDEAQHRIDQSSSSSSSSSSSGSSGSGGEGGQEEYRAPDPEKYLVPSGGCGSCSISSENKIDPFFGLIGLLYLVRRRKK